MGCPNVKECACPKKTCPNNGKCCACVIEHNEDMGNASEQSEPEAAQITPMPVDNFSADNNILENTTTLTFMKEGEQEQKQATLAIGNGYSFYLPDDEQWRLYAPDLWKTDINEQVTLWITNFEGESEDSVNQKLEGDGYTEEDSHKWWKQEGDLIYTGYRNDKRYNGERIVRC